MLILGLNTSGLSLSLTLLETRDVIAHRNYGERRGQSEMVLPVIESALREAGRNLNDIKAIAVVAGPGSFTGLRLGIAAGLGLSRSLGIPAGGFNRFSLLRDWAESKAQPQNTSRFPVIVLESLRRELYVELHRDSPAMLTAEELAEALSEPPDAANPDQQWTLLGDATEKVPHTLPELPMPDEDELAARAAEKLLARGETLPPLSPCYLRAPDISQSKSPLTSITTEPPQEEDKQAS